MSKRISVNVQTGVTTESTLTDAEIAQNSIGATDAAAKLYIHQRRKSYPDIGDQLDDLYKKGAFSDDMAAKIKKVKEDNPKP
tara:strand:+ start:639 stop:884 length:246 start_codon:yes stop_codon:yes gene_type:complete